MTDISTDASTDVSAEPPSKRVKIDNHSETKDQLNIENIDPEGDVVIICEYSSLRVSSKVLSLASPVFKALLGPGFREGNFERSTVSPLKLELSEDDEIAMTILLKIMHFSPEVYSTQDVSKQGAGCYDLFKNVAILANKYCCGHVIFYVSHYWCIPLAKSANMQQLDSLAQIAYIARNNSMFDLIITRMMRADSTGLELVSSPCLRGMLQAKKLAQAEVRGSLITHVQRSLDKLHNTHEDYHRMGSFICHGKYRLNTHMKVLAQVSLDLSYLQDMDHPGTRDYLPALTQATIPLYKCRRTAACPLYAAWSQLRTDLATVRRINMGTSMADFIAALQETDSEW